MQMLHLNPSDFPGSLFAAELRRGAARFEPPLEAQYKAAHLERVRLHVRIWFSMTLVLAALFTADTVRRFGLWHVLSLLHVCVLLPCTAALAWMPWSRYYQRIYLPVAGVLVTLFGSLIATFIALALIAGHSEQFAALTVNLMGVFFFAGLMLRQALTATILALIAFVVASKSAGLPHDILLRSMIVLTLTTLIVAIVYRDMERTHRREFLEQALIGELVARDALSGLMNRRAFDEHLLRVWQHALRDQRSISILMIDIDQFKQYNDTYGHQAGDDGLRRIAQVIQGFARRPLDIAARYGGEEFCVILYDLALPHVQDIAERLRQAVQNLPTKFEGDVEGLESKVSISVGVGTAVPSIGRTPQGVVQLADEALYEAKQTGRNRVVVKGTDAYRLMTTGAFRSPQ
jgi:diguanylate cyclase (GGDEF)-like protein